MNLLNEREKTHGRFEDVAHMAQEFKTTVEAIQDTHGLPWVHKEALDMIFVKIARIVCGDHNEIDHWTDLIGYSQLVLNYIKKDVPGSSPTEELPDGFEHVQTVYEDECDFCGGDIYHRPWCILRRNEG